jgi:hypothetical protein
MAMNAKLSSGKHSNEHHDTSILGHSNNLPEHEPHQHHSGSSLRSMHDEVSREDAGHPDDQWTKGMPNPTDEI